MTKPPFDIDRIRDDLNQRKARTPERVLTPGRKRQSWGSRPLTVGMLFINDVVLVIVGAILGAWLW